MIGFSAPLVDLTGLSLEIKINGGALQTFNFTGPMVVEAINTVIEDGQAYFAQGGRFIVRSNARKAPGSIEIVGGTALTVLGLTPKLITERSDAELLGTVTANANASAMEAFNDHDGAIEDFYAISSINSVSAESLKTPWAQPIQTAGPVCVIEGVIADLQGVRIPDAEIIATIQVAPKNLSMAYITKEPIRTRSGPDGRFSLPLLQCALVKLEIPAISYMQMVTIPKASYILIQDLLVDENYTYPIGYR
jgi:hypothetical protein